MQKCNGEFGKVIFGTKYSRMYQVIEVVEDSLQKIWLDPFDLIQFDFVSFKTVFKLNKWTQLDFRRKQISKYKDFEICQIYSKLTKKTLEKTT